jgi:hypothetical protein
MNYKNYDKFMNASHWTSFSSIDSFAAYLGVLFDTKEDSVNIDIVVPITKVTVHQVKGYPMYVFNLGRENATDFEYLVSLDSTKNECEDMYDIIIKCNHKSEKIFEIDEIKTGTLFKTALLQQLNHWYTKKFLNKARFTWGEPVILTKENKSHFEPRN